MNMTRAVGLLILFAAIPATAADKISNETLSDVNTQLDRFGANSVIVELESTGLRSALGVSGLSDSARAAVVRSVISAFRNSLAAEHHHRIAHEYRFLPAVVVSVDEETVETLRGNPYVKGIYKNEFRKPSLLESVNLVFPNHAGSPYNGNGQWAVAVLDSGVDKNHGFLKTNEVQKVISEACFSGADIVSPVIDPLCPGDARSSTAAGSGVNCSGYEGCEHGTHVAGIAAGDRDESYEDGVAHKGKIISIQVFTGIEDFITCGGSPTCIGAADSDILKGLERVYALRSTYQIGAVNLSLGGGRFTGACDSENSLVTQAINNLRNVDIATVVASGNEYYTDAVSFPGCISSAVTVGATYDAGANEDQEASYSNAGIQLDLFAPGSYITSSVPEGRFETYRGTSMAAPHVAGAFAVLRHAKPTATVNEIEGVFKSVGPVVTSASGYARRRLDISTAIDQIVRQRSSTPLMIPILEQLLLDE